LTNDEFKNNIRVSVIRLFVIRLFVIIIDACIEGCFQEIDDFLNPGGEDDGNTRMTGMTDDEREENSRMTMNDG
jgi:hypothetical protein